MVNAFAAFILAVVAGFAAERLVPSHGIVPDILYGIGVLALVWLVVAGLRRLLRRDSTGQDSAGTAPPVGRPERAPAITNEQTRRTANQVVAEIRKIEGQVDRWLERPERWMLDGRRLPAAQWRAHHDTLAGDAQLASAWDQVSDVYGKAENVNAERERRAQQADSGLLREYQAVGRVYDDADNDPTPPLADDEQMLRDLKSACNRAKWELDGILAAL